MLVAVCCGLLLVAPLTWLLGATSYVGVLLGLIAAVVLAAAFGQLLQGALPGSLGTALVTTACFLPLVLIALLVVGPGSGRLSTAVALGVPAAALSAALATRTAMGLEQDRGREGVLTGAILVGLSLALCAAALAPKAVDRIEDGRLTAAIVAGLEGNGVLPLLPAIDGYRPSDEPRVALDSDGYWIDLVTDDDARVETSSVRVDVGALLSAEDAEIERSSCDGGQRTCTTDEEGFDVIEDPGSETRVVAVVGRTRMEATLYSGEGELPEPEEVGRALLDAGLVGWDDLLRLTHEGR